MGRSSYGGGPTCPADPVAPPDPESKGPPGPLLRVVHADAGTALHRTAWDGRCIEDAEARRREVRPVLGPSNAERATQPARSIEPHRTVEASDRLEAAHQHRRRPALRSRDRVEAPVHPVDEVHVGPP